MTTTKEIADQNKDEQYILDELAYAVKRDSWFEINGRSSSILQSMLKNKDVEIEQLRKDLDTRKLAIGALVHAYDNEWKVGDAMVRARKIMADGYDPWVEIEQLKTGNRLHLELAEIKDAEIERLREALQSIKKIPNSEAAYGITQTFVDDALKEKE